MNRDQMSDLMGRLEALEALAKLFDKLWFERIREDIQDPKVQAYLTVFDDAFPQMNHVIEFVRRSAGFISDGETGSEQWSRLQGEFDDLHRLLKSQGGAASTAAAAPIHSNTEITGEEKKALESVDQSDIDSLVSKDASVTASEEDFGLAAATVVVNEDRTAEGTDDEAEVSGEGDVDELENFFEDEDEEEQVNADDDLGELLEENGGDEESDMAAGISADEMSALLEEDNSGNDVGVDTALEEIAEDEVAEADGGEKKADDDEESINEDEIDALFG